MPVTPYTLQKIAQAAQLPAERVRYVIDQKILPGHRKVRGRAPASRGRGTPRAYSAFEAFGIACAAAMIGAGLRRRTVRKCFDLVCSAGKPSDRNLQDMPLYRAFQNREAALLEVGDHVNLRIYAIEQRSKRRLDDGWRQIETGAALTDYEPLVVVAINVAKLRRAFA